MVLNRNLKAGWTEVTPAHLRCGVGLCPAVFRTDTGSFVVIGRTLTASEIQSALPNRVASDETAIEIDAEFLEKLVR